MSQTDEQLALNVKRAIEEANAQLREASACGLEVVVDIFPHWVMQDSSDTPIIQVKINRSL